MVKKYINKTDDTIDRVFGLLMSKDVLVYLIGIIIVLLIAGSTAFDRVLREDAYNFVVTGMRIAHGDFGSFQKQSVGWPLFLAGIFWLAQVETVFGAMRIARWTTIILIALSVIPLAHICKQILPNRHYATACLSVLMAFASAPLIHFAGKNAMSEPLFMLLTMLAALAFISNGSELRNIVIAAILLGLAYWVRPNALFVFIALIGSIGLRYLFDSTNKARDIIVALVVFVAVCTPYWFTRYLEFGSAFDYGPNSKYFVDDYEQVWADNIKNPSLITYLSTHSWSEIYQKFVERGVFNVLEHLFNRVLPIHWVLLATLSFLVVLWKGLSQKITIVHMVIAMTIIGMTPVFDIFASVRHLIYLVPFLLVAAVWFVSSLEAKDWRYANIIFSILILITTSTFIPIKTYGYKHLGLPVVQDHWAVWAARNIDGKVVIIEGADILRMSQHYKREGIRVPRRFSEVARSIRTIRPGIYDDLSTAVEEFRQLGIEYVITDKNHIKRRPYLREISDEKWSDVFQHLGYYEIGDPGAVLYGVNIYRLNFTNDQP